MARPSRVAAAFAAAFLIGSLFNVALEIQVPAGSRALRASSSGDLATLAAETQRSVRIGYAFPAALHDVARGGVLVVANAAAIRVDEIENLALMGISVEEFDPALPAGRAADLLELADLEGVGALRRGGGDTTFAIVADEPVAEGTRFRLLFFEEAAFVVDERVLARVQR